MTGQEDELDSEKEPRMVGVREAARLAGVSEQTIRNYKTAEIIRGQRNPYNNRREIYADDAMALRRRD